MEGCGFRDGWGGRIDGTRVIVGRQKSMEDGLDL